MQRLVAKIGYTDGRVVSYPITPKLQLQFEKNFGVGVARINDGNQGMTNIYNLAWLTQKANVGDYPGALPLVEEWLDAVDAIEVENEDVIPFGQAASVNGSSTSALPAGSLTAPS